ncbi:MerR family transcriptional regulator [Streptomyces thermodiastaticus]|uniref:MerR family transcriptional regulator n=1 Tax=Streptomyces thermodiastaticus TaxID=44061 RepID=UPI0016750609|nr:MerR family transcriptional regulator [Streptomyces thermodiastaticus]MCE7552398.1 MerR family transcriptional regulator [Streptomyces thermodiastaticus]GHF83531.1 transcriptional regulator [Streptomyces thermodiastaticus]
MTTPDAAEPAYTVDELAARAGVTVRTVRFYSSRGLLPPPVLGPRRVGRYGEQHLARLDLIGQMRRQGMTLAAIERHLRQLPPGLSPRELAVQRAVVASWAPESEETIGRRELDRRAGRPLSDEDLRRLAAMGVLARAADGDREEGAADPGEQADRTGGAAEERYRVDTGLLRLGVELLDVPLSQETVLAARSVLTEHSRAAAHELSELLRAAVAGRGTEDVRSLSAHMHPLVVQALLTTFQRSLRQELRAWLHSAGE